jgi:glycosyltransferase involved in cell wall biosynthesis
MRTLSILAPTRYPWRFNSPRESRHAISIRNFIPVNKVSRAAEGLTIFNPFPPRRFDLVHAFNRIPLGPTPFVIGFESHLPRAFGFEQGFIFRHSASLLAGDRCRRIVAISEYAKRQFLRQHRGSAACEALQSKLEVRYPNLPVPAELPAFAPAADGRIRLLFVGNHFARKGGCVALRMAELAARNNLPIDVEIVSAFEVGAVSWVDPLDPSFFERDRVLPTVLGNVTHHPALPNARVIEMVKRADFVLLPTFSDTFGYSAIEAMAQGTPVIATDQGALPEFIDDQNGILLGLDRDEVGEWKHIGRKDRDSEAYATMFREETNRLAEEALARVEAAMADRAGYLAMRAAAHAKARALFDAGDATTYWDELYEQAVP